MGRKQIHPPAMAEFLLLHGAATSRQLADLIGSKTSFAYRPLRRLKKERIADWTALDPELGSISQRVWQLWDVARQRLFREDELQEADAHLQAEAEQWEWIQEPGSLPWIEKGEVRMPVVGSLPGDDAKGVAAAERIVAVAQATGAREISYTDPDLARARRVANAFRTSTVIVHAPWRSYRDRPDPRRKPDLDAEIREVYRQMDAAAQK